MDVLHAKFEVQLLPPEAIVQEDAEIVPEGLELVTQLVPLHAVPKAQDAVGAAVLSTTLL